MALGVFIHRHDSIYDDSSAERYQFPRQYLGRVQACIGEWIIYYEPRKVAGTRGYFAIARAQEIVPDPSAADMFLAIIAPGSHLDFACPVPFSDADGPVERGVLNQDGRVSGRAQSAVRPISEADFHHILGRGLDEANALLPRVVERDVSSGFVQPPHAYMAETERPRLTSIVSRTVRDRV